MSDTQWPRYMVFHQAKPGKPHQHFGTVHAPDPEMALFNARDVFVRRPECANIWVVPDAQILTRTQQQIEASRGAKLEIDESGTEQTYHIFQKKIHAGMSIHVGDVIAISHEHALAKALQKYADDRALWWWIVPAAAVYRSTQDDVPSMFAPAWDKASFRDQGEFLTVAELRKIRAQNRKEQEDV